MIDNLETTPRRWSKVDEAVKDLVANTPETMSESTMEKLQSDPRYDKSFVDFVKWFNRWLAEPISDREAILLGEAIGYLKYHKVQRWRNPDEKAN